MAPDINSRTGAPLVSAAEMRDLEEQADRAGISGGALMEAAGLGLAGAVEEIFRRSAPGTAVVFAGKGHNAGDAFVMAAQLARRGWKLQIRLAWPRQELKPLALRQLELLEKEAGDITFADPEENEVPSGRPLVLIDGLLGIGAGGTLRGPARRAVDHLNFLRGREHAVTLAIDLPSGLGSDPCPVRADHTVTPGWPKDLLFADEAAAWTGRLHHLPLARIPLPENADLRDSLVTASWLRPLLPEPSAFDRHKGQSGRIGILAGSCGLTGAARLASTAAAVMGGGLVTLFCPAEVYGILAASCPPEVMVRPIRSCQEVMDFPLDALGVGPGLGQAPPPNLLTLLLQDPRPLIVDADALNALAALKSWQKEAPPPRSGNGATPDHVRDGPFFSGPRLLTPHPGELARLVKAWNPDLLKQPRRVQAGALAEAFGVTVLAKSARSLTIQAGHPALWNSTGHALMARGGMGDVLTGFLTAFAARGMNLRHASALGSWVLGRGAELYHESAGHVEPGLATEIMHHAAGPAMAELRAGNDGLRRG